MNKPPTLLKLVVAFLVILLGLQLFSFFRKAEPSPALKEIREEMKRIGSVNDSLQGSLNQMNRRTEMIDQMLAEQLQKYQDKIDGIRAEIGKIQARSGQLQLRVDNLIMHIRTSGAPEHLPTLNDLKQNGN